MMLMTLSYVSISCRPIQSSELISLAKKYSENNARNGITGMLLYHDMRFMQVIEGTEENIELLFSKIKADPLHRQIVEIFKDPITDREFLNWSLGLVDGVDLKEADRNLLNRFLVETDTHPTSPELSGRGSKMLHHFKEIMTRW